MFFSLFELKRNSKLQSKMQSNVENLELRD